MDYTQILSFLKPLPLFEGTSQEALLQALAEKGASVHTLSSGKSMDISAEKSLYVLLRGCAQIRSLDEERNVILRTLQPGAVFGAAALFLKDSPPISAVEASDDCDFLSLSADTVRTLMQRDAAFLDAYLTLLAERVRFLNKKIKCFTGGSAERRVALWLLGEEEDSVSLSISLQAMSDTLDIGRASLYRALDKLEAQGLISREGRRITLISREALRRKYE